MDKRTVVIELVAGSGAGKSTSAAKLFVHLKEQGKCVELVREIIKVSAWRGIPVTAHEQLHLMYAQTKLEMELYDHVDILITDSPTFLTAFYALKYFKDNGGKGSVESYNTIYAPELIARRRGTMSHFLSRENVFDTRGRYETLEQATDNDGAITNFFYTSLPEAYLKQAHVTVGGYNALQAAADEFIMRMGY